MAAMRVNVLLAVLMAASLVCAASARQLPVTTDATLMGPAVALRRLLQPKDPNEPKAATVAADTASIRFKIVFEKGQKKEDDKEGDK